MARDRLLKDNNKNKNEKKKHQKYKLNGISHVCDEAVSFLTSEIIVQVEEHDERTENTQREDGRVFAHSGLEDASHVEKEWSRRHPCSRPSKQEL